MRRTASAELGTITDFTFAAEIVSVSGGKPNQHMPARQTQGEQELRASPSERPAQGTIEDFTFAADGLCKALHIHKRHRQHSPARQTQRKPSDPSEEHAGLACRMLPQRGLHIGCPRYREVAY